MSTHKTVFTFLRAWAIMQPVETPATLLLGFKPFKKVLTYSPGQVSGAVNVLHLCPGAQRLARSVDGHVGIYSQLALCGGRRWRSTLSGKGVWVQRYDSSEKNKREEGRETESDFHTRHVALTGAQGLQDELKLSDSCSSLLSTAHFWLHHQLHQTYT